MAGRNGTRIPTAVKAFVLEEHKSGANFEKLFAYLADEQSEHTNRIFPEEKAMLQVKTSLVLAGAKLKDKDPVKQLLSNAINLQTRKLSYFRKLMQKFGNGSRAALIDATGPEVFEREQASRARALRQAGAHKGSVDRRPQNAPTTINLFKDVPT